MADQENHPMIAVNTGDGPSIMDDRRNNPSRRKKEIKVARGWVRLRSVCSDPLLIPARLWARGFVEITNKHDSGTTSTPRYISKNLICSLSGRFRDLLPTQRSWPILAWGCIIDDMWKFGFWTAIDNFLAFVYAGSDSCLSNFKANGRPDSSKPDGVFFWCMGQALSCPKLQNVAMTMITKLDTYWEQELSKHDHSSHSSDDEDSEYEDGVLCNAGRFFIADQHLKNYGMICAPHKMEVSFRKHKLMSYIVDRLIWEEKQGGKLWLHYVHNGGCLASMVAQGMVESAYCTAFRLMPWHPMNHEMYLVEE